MLNLCETTMSPGAAIVKLLAGKPSLGASTHAPNNKTNHQLLYLVEPMNRPAKSARGAHGAEIDPQEA